MKIVSIFEERLYAFKFQGEKYHEFRRLLNLWSDPMYLVQFLKNNKNDLPENKTIPELAQTIANNAKQIDETLKRLGTNKKEKMEAFFSPLNNFQYQFRILAEQKGRENYLRVYALKIDENCFVITGGTIKFTHLMEDRIHTREELMKNTQCRDYLLSEQIFDLVSFKDLLNNQ